MREMIRAYGFNQDWISWIMSLTYSTFFSILLNGALMSMFRLSRCIHQGDPLSPFLFILMTEGLTRLIKKMMEKRDIKGLNLHNGADKQTHQQFVDYTMLMGSRFVSEIASF